MRIKNYITERYSLQKALLHYLNNNRLIKFSFLYLLNSILEVITVNLRQLDRSERLKFLIQTMIQSKSQTGVQVIYGINQNQVYLPDRPLYKL